MGTLQQLENWSITHHPKWLVVLRIALGFSLLLKGISFISNDATLQNILQQSIFSSQNWLVTLIPWAHLLGGILIIVGLFTRWAVLLQIPILAGAFLLVLSQKSFMGSQSELGLSLMILVLLFVFFIEGGGPISLDDYFRRNPK
ncbi:DoxX family protein [Lacibacter luteus]|uniref:DoxX family protein n=1 Tax=Lacibacter luteus TaxID=2508719 RepID=A0A4Q1CND0_9BACT|nr:DoxX family protein [Lacibacter luteus]RXK62324.1 DoxX family protein [Lacibacter luteus]